MMRAAVYSRVSTEGQDLVGQERDLQREVERRGWSLIETYPEKVRGTGKVERTEYDRLLRDAAAEGRPLNHLLVWALDRFSREAMFTKATQAGLDLERRGVAFHSLKEPTLDTPEDGKPNLGRDVLLALLPGVASFESKRRSERVRVVIRKIREGRRQTRSGRPPGRPRRVTPELLEKIRVLREERHLPWSQIAQILHVRAGSCHKWFSDAARVREVAASGPVAGARQMKP